MLAAFVAFFSARLLIWAAVRTMGALPNLAVWVPYLLLDARRLV